MQEVQIPAKRRGRPKGSKNQKQLARDFNGSRILNHVVEQIAAQPNERDEEIDARIKQTFRVMDKVTNGVISGVMPSVIISGAAGCGKTFQTEAKLEKAAEDGLIEWSSVKGTISPIGLFKQLWAHKDSNQVLLLDDCDSVFGDIEALNILKAALDTSKVRKISWHKQSKVLEEEGIPNTFEFQGSVMFITNIDFAAEINKGRGNAVHYMALLTRSIYVDLGIHSKREVFVRIKQVVFNTTFAVDNKLNAEQLIMMMNWLRRNMDNVRALSIRTAVQLSILIRTDHDWEEVAEVVMLNRRLLNK